MLTPMDELLELAKKSAYEAGAIIMSYYGNAIVTEKMDTSPVTDADVHAHDHLMTTLASSNIPVLSEEGLEVPHPYPQYIWIIDPIDGTRGFINETGDFAVMIGLLEHGRPVLGVVYTPAADTMYFALKDAGAYMMHAGKKLKLAVSDRIAPALHALTSKNHVMPYMQEVAIALGVTESISMGGIGVKAGIVAESRGDYFLTLGALGEWDVCAPEIIVLEAGGKVTDRYGAALTYDNDDSHIKNGVVFSNNACHGEVLTALETVLAQK